MTPHKGSPTDQNLTRKSQSDDGAEAMLSAPLVAALEEAWGAIRRRHPEVPPAMLTVGSGTSRSSPGVVLGHYAPERWQANAGGEVLPEILIGGEGLVLGAREALVTLLHEAAHALAQVRGVKDTSRQGRYHNKRFKALGEELGLVITRVDAIGWSGSELPTATADAYRQTLRDLDAALTMHRRSELPAGPAKPSRSPIAAVCGCGRRIRVAPSVLGAGPIVCGLCAKEFEREVTEDEGEGSAT